VEREGSGVGHQARQARRHHRDQRPPELLALRAIERSEELALRRAHDAQRARVHVAALRRGAEAVTTPVLGIPFAARTQSARLGTLVTGVTYRNPALLAKAVTALDVISNGRALLGIGAAWFELEHESLDVRFPPVAERFDRLQDALEICKGMFTQRRTTYRGKHHSVTDAWNSPAPVTPGGPPILVGGTGEKKTARLAAQHADDWNCNASFVELPR
jgi:alkanesulfonate monooxygenase SsuD/methylene tetrahydromethanopterin reductase-like flavin-dependent oxidoreductase (luciferase family)